MSTDNLYLTPFENALGRLQEGYVRYQKDIHDTQIRDGLIQRFEFTYDISHKMLKRYLEKPPQILNNLMQCPLQI